MARRLGLPSLSRPRRAGASTATGSDIRWELREGQDVIGVEPGTSYSNPFDKVLHPNGTIGLLYLCAKVQGVEGCLYGHTIP